MKRFAARIPHLCVAEHGEVQNQGCNDFGIRRLLSPDATASQYLRCPGKNAKQHQRDIHVEEGFGELSLS